MDCEIPKHLLDELPVEEIVKSLNFKKNMYGCYEGKMDILNISMCYGGVVTWQLIISFSISHSLTKRNSMLVPDDFVIPGKIAPIELFLMFYNLWKDACGDDNDKLLPMELYYGKIYYENKKSLKKMVPSAPTLLVDREFLRFCINQLDKNIDRTTIDYDIEFSKCFDQLQIKAKDLIFYCPADGDWIGSMITYSSDFFDSVPKRFLAETVHIQAHPDYILINSHQIKARYIESESQ